MKKPAVLFAALFFIVSGFVVPVAPAQTLVPMPGIVTPAGLEKIGVVAAAGGKVELTTPGQVGRIAQSGQAIFMGDEVKTDAKGHLQILLLDETVFTIGPNSAIIIDQFVYDPKSHAGEIRASITKGVFRYVSGKIAAKDPDSVKVKLPTATLGFRGTIVGGSVGENGQGLAALLGPGDNNDAGAQNGSFTIDGEGGDHQDVNRTGFGVEVGADGGLSDVFQLSDDQVNGLIGGLGGGQGGGGGGDEGNNQDGLGGNTDMGDLSGENNVLAGENGALMSGLSNLTDGLNDASVLGAQNARNESGVSVSNANGITTMAELATILSGSYDYSGSGDFYTTINSGAPSSIPGTVTASWTLDFDSKYLTNVQVTVASMSGGIGGSTGITATMGDVPFPVGGDAVFTPLIDPGHPWISANITFKNVDGQIAEQGKIDVKYDDPPSFEGNGGATAPV
jgi:hypothetical protein